MLQLDEVSAEMVLKAVTKGFWSGKALPLANVWRFRIKQNFSNLPNMGYFRKFVKKNNYKVMFGTLNFFFYI